MKQSSVPLDRVAKPYCNVCPSAGASKDMSPWSEVQPHYSVFTLAQPVKVRRAPVLSHRRTGTPCHNNAPRSPNHSSQPRSSQPPVVNCCRLYIEVSFEIPHTKFSSTPALLLGRTLYRTAPTDGRGGEVRDTLYADTMAPLVSLSLRSSSVSRAAGCDVGVVIFKRCGVAFGRKAILKVYLT